MRKRTFEERLAQLGNIAIIEANLMGKHTHGLLPRTKKAKAILKTYEMNAFGRELDVCGDDREIAHKKKLSNDEWRGIPPHKRKK